MILEKGVLLIGFAAFLVPAQMPVTFEENVRTYIGEFENGRISHHRSGMAIDAGSPLFEESTRITRFSNRADNPMSPIEAERMWRSSTIPEFEVTHGGLGEIKKLLEPGMKAAGLELISMDTLEDEIRFSTPFDSTDLVPNSSSNYSEHDLIAVASKAAQRYLKPFKGRIEYSNPEISYMNSRISKVNVRFRRIFLNGIIMKDMSYIYVQVDGTGRLKQIRIRWPQFTELASTDSAFTMEQTVKFAEEVYAGLEEVRLGTKIVRAKKAKVIGMAAGWLPIFKDGTTRITPCYGFSATIDFDSGSSDQKFMEIPLLHRYGRR